MNIRFFVGLVLFICIALLYTSGNGAIRANSDQPTSPSEVRQACTKILTFESLDLGYHYSDAETFGLDVINDWNQAEVAEYLILPHQGLPLSSYDYSKYFVVAISVRVLGHGRISLEVEELCRHEKSVFIELKNSIIIEVDENRDEGYAHLHHIVLVEREDEWDTEIDFFVSMDSNHIFIQAQSIANPRRFETIESNIEQSVWSGQQPNFMVISTDDEIPSVAEFVSSEALATLQELDYEESYALVAFQGQQPSDGYGIEIEELSRAGNRVVIHTQTTEPNGSIETHPEITSPYHLIRVDRFYENGDELDFVLAVDGTEVLTRTAIIDQNPPIPTPTPFLTPTPTPTPMVPIITASNHTVQLGGKADVMIEAFDFENISAATMDVVYNPDVVQAISCNTDVNQVFGMCNPNYKPDTVRFIMSTAKGFSGNLRLAEITFEAVGQSGDESAIELEVANMAYTNGNEVAIVSLVNGQVTLSGQPMGDVNCDDLRNPVDSLFILQYDVNLRTGSETCTPSPRSAGTLYTAACDINADGQCDAVDALIILQCDVGLRNEVC